MLSLRENYGHQTLKCATEKSWNFFFWHHTRSKREKKWKISRKNFSRILSSINISSRCGKEVQKRALGSTVQCQCLKTAVHSNVATTDEVFRSFNWNWFDFNFHELLCFLIYDERTGDICVFDQFWLILVILEVFVLSKDNFWQCQNSTFPLRSFSYAESLPFIFHQVQKCHYFNEFSH